MTYIKVNNTLYPAIKIDGNSSDSKWDRRETKEIKLAMTYDEVLELMPDGTPWSIICDEVKEVEDEDGNFIPTLVQKDVDNSAYNMSGTITDNRDGTCTIKMGKPTEIETVLNELETEVGI